MSAPVRWLPLLGAALASLSGCLAGPADFSSEAKAIEARSGLSLVPTTSMRVGALARALAGAFAPDSEALLEHLERVEVGVFSVSGGSARQAVAAFPAETGWTCLVHARQRAAAARIFLEERSERVARLFIVASNGDELVLVRLEGSLDRLLEAALRPQAVAQWTSAGPHDGPQRGARSGSQDEDEDERDR